MSKYAYTGKILEYEILTDISADGLTEKVEGALMRGMQPFGGLVVIVNSGNDYYEYVQAVVKYELEEVRSG